MMTMEHLQAWLSKLGIALVAADELEHETQQPDRNQTGLQAGLVGKLMDIALAVTNPQFTYIRVHRRCEPAPCCSQSFLTVVHQEHIHTCYASCI